MTLKIAFKKLANETFFNHFGTASHRVLARGPSRVGGSR